MPWYFMILDEAHHIKNSKSQRWQTLLNFKSKRRLLLTGALPASLPLLISHLTSAQARRCRTR